MSNIVGSILPAPAIKSTVRGLQNVQARTVAIGAPKSMGDLSDVDLSAVGDGALLVYNGVLQKFVANPELNNSNTKIVGGSF
jgi:hypothetical protein